MKKAILTASACALGICTACIANSCSSETTETKSASSGIKPSTASTASEPLNLSVYLDLSDRIVKGKGAVSQLENDTALINCIFESFLNQCKKNILANKDHFQILFYPQPSQPNINMIAKSLNLDLSKVDVTQKKKSVINFQNTYQENLLSIYNSTIKSHHWIGSDIWGFFSNKKVDQLCIREGYRNVLVIITDGYIFHTANKIAWGNAYSYILPQTLAKPNSSLIVKRDGLENLEVLMLEITPPTSTEYIRMKRILTDWFTAMGVRKLSINETDISANTETIINNFLN